MTDSGMGRPPVTFCRYSGISSRDWGVPCASSRTAWRGDALSGTGMISGVGAELAHVLHHSLHIFDWRARDDAMAEIEDVSGPAAGLLHNLMHPLAQQILL